MFIPNKPPLVLVFVLPNGDVVLAVLPNPLNVVPDGLLANKPVPVLVVPKDGLFCVPNMPPVWF